MTVPRSPVVWVVQEPWHKDATGKLRPVNLTPALDFGKLELLLETERQISVLNVAVLVRAIQGKLTRYEAGDFILLAGDPVAIGVTCAIAAIRGGGVFTVLKWDRQEARYVAVPINLKGAA